MFVFIHSLTSHRTCPTHFQYSKPHLQSSHIQPFILEFSTLSFHSQQSSLLPSPLIRESPQLNMLRHSRLKKIHFVDIEHPNAVSNNVSQFSVFLSIAITTLRLVNCLMNRYRCLECFILSGQSIHPELHLTLPTADANDSMLPLPLLSKHPVICHSMLSYYR